MPLNLNALRLFSAVARTGNVTRAAAAVHISQPAISRAIRELEHGLGVTLLERGARGVRLTDAGHALADHARALFGIARTAEADMQAFATLGRGILRLGASTTIAHYLLWPAVAEFRRRQPAVEVTLVSANTAEIARRLLAYELDVALVEGPVAEASIVATPWRRDDLILIARADHRLAGRTVAWRQVSSEVLLVREGGSGTREVVSQALAAAGFDAPRTMELGSTEAIKQAVAAGLGLGFVSTAAAADQLALGRVTQVRVRKLAISRMLIRLEVPGRRPSVAAAAFTTLLHVVQSRP
jgi:DNA-binding transcriptional LysR family regulator